MNATPEALFRQLGLRRDPLVSIHTQSGIFKFVNQAALEVFQVSSAELIGQNWRDFFSPKKQVAEEEAVAKVTATGKSHFTIAEPTCQPSGVCITTVRRLSILNTGSCEPLLMRESFSIDGDEMFWQKPPNADVEPLAFIASQATFLRGLAQQNGEMFLAYLIDMTRLQARKLLGE